MAPSSSVSNIEGFYCFICIAKKFPRTFIEGEFKNLTSHLRTIHALHTCSSASGTPLVCAQNGCEEIFNSFSNFRNHLMRCSGSRRRSVNTVFAENFAFPNPAVDSRPVDGAAINDDCIEMLNEPYLENDWAYGELERNLASFLLNLRSQHLVSNTALDFIANNFGAIFEKYDNRQNNTSITSLLKNFNTEKKDQVFSKVILILLSQELYLFQQKVTTLFELTPVETHFPKQKIKLSSTYPYGIL